VRVTVKRFRWTLPEPPSANRYWRHVGARVLLSREARKYRKTVADLLPGQSPECPPGSLVEVSIAWYRGRKSGDLDNRIKQLLDALKGIAYADDAEIGRLSAERFDDKANPRAVVTISFYPAP